MKHLRKALLTVVSTLTIYAQQPATQKGGSISGKVIFGETLEGLRGASVLAVSPNLDSDAAKRATAITDETGNFNIADLPPGLYTVCATLSGSDLLQPCEWGPGVRTVVVSGQLSMAEVRFERGRKIDVRVTDPAGALDRNERTKGSGVHLLVGMWKGTEFHPARITEGNSTSRVYSAVVPFDTLVQLSVRGQNVDTKDNNGKAVGKQDRIDINEPRANGRSPKVFDYTVSGVTPLCNNGNGNGNGNGNCKP